MRKMPYRRIVGWACVGMVLCLMPVTVAAARAGLLIIRADGQDYAQTAAVLQAELANEFASAELIIAKTTPVSDIAAKMAQVKPQLVVLMDNIAISRYKQYQAAQPSSAPVVPVVAVMASFMELALAGMPNAAGIAYEVPIVTSVVNLRMLLPKPLKKVGVVHRDFMQAFVTQNAQFCGKEQIELIAEAIPSQEKLKTPLKEALASLKRQGVDALWVPNDSVLVNQELLQSVWQPFAKEFKKLIIVGAEVLVTPTLNFGAFAVVPDHGPLGVQAADLAMEIRANNWQADTGRVDPPQSVYKILNGAQAARLKISADKLELVDKIAK